MSKIIYELLKKRILLLDGAMGTQLQNKKLTHSDFDGKEHYACYDFLSLTRPDIIKNIHKEYLDAGADIITTNTICANSIDLSKYNLSDKVYKINKRASIIAKECANNYCNKFVAGSIGPTQECISITSKLNLDKLKYIYYEQAIGLIEGACDLILIETCIDLLNIKAAVIGVNKAKIETKKEIPIMISISLMDNGKLLSGEDIEIVYNSLITYNPLAFGINCSIGPIKVKKYIHKLSMISQLPVILYPNAGIPDKNGKYNETPSSFKKYMKEYVNNGWVNIIGGCCGTTPEHIRLLKEI